PNEDPTDEEWQSFLKRPEDVLLKCFPSQIQATKVMSVLDVLSSHSPDEEYIGGKTEPAWEADPTIKAAFEEFRGRLNELEGIIDSRNTDATLKNRSGAGLVPYQLLKPYSDKGVTGRDIKCVLSRKAFDAFSEKFHIPEEVHPVLPNRHFRINLSQLSVIGTAKVSHFEILRCVYGITPTVGLFRCFYVNSKKNGWMSFNKRSDKSPVCYTKPLDSLKNWNDHFFWVDDFACPALFQWHTAKNMTRDPAPVAADFNAHDYATLVAHPSPFWKFPEEFLCLVGLNRHYTLDEETYPWFFDKDGEDMDIFAFIHTPDPTKVKVVKPERIKDEPRLLETNVGRIVPLLPVMPDHAESELEASVDKLFDEGGSGNQAGQRDSAGVGEGANIQPVTEATDIVAEDVAPLQPRRQRKRKTVVVSAGEASYPLKKLREDHGTLSGAFLGGKSRSAVQRLLAGAVLNAKVRGELIPTLPFVTSSVSATPGREGGDHTDFVTGPNLRTIGASQRFVISSNCSHHSGTNVAEAEVDYLIRSSIPVMTIVTIVTSTVDTAAATKEKPVEASLFGAASSSAGGADPIPGDFSDRTGSDFLVGGIPTFIDSDTNLQKVYVPQWNVTNRSRLDDSRICCEMVNEFAPPKFFAYVRGMEHDQLFTEFNVGVAHQISLSVEVRMRVEYNIKEKRRLNYIVDEQAKLLKVREREIKSLKAQLLLKEAEAAEAIRLRAEASKFESIEKYLQDEMKTLKERNTTLEKEKNDLDEDIFLPLERLLVMLLRKACKMDYLPESPMLRSNKDASVDTLINILRLEETLTERLGLSELQAHVDQLMVPIHRSPDQFVLGASALSLALDVSSSRVRKIKENIANHRSALCDVFVPLAEPLSVTTLTGKEGTSNVIPATTDTTTALSITFASASIIAPIFVYDYEVVGTDSQADADGNAKPFPNVDDT
ncbi:gypsy type transposase, partial [Tanacetum coccineum]